jgi:hypothetical protein
MLRITVERLVRPHDHVVVPSLFEEGECNPHMRECRRLVAFKSTQFQLKSAIQLTEGLHQLAVMEVRLGVIRVEGQGPLEAPLGGEPI